MSERIGNCEQCGQRFGGIPDSVTALKVKCTECGGTVVIPPLPEAPAAAAPPAPAPQEVAPTAPAKETPAKEKPLAAPLGDLKPKGNGRPNSAKPVDRGVVAAKKPEAPKVAKPIVPLKPVAKITKPIKPLNPVVRLAKPVVPVKPVAKPAAPKAVAPAPKPVVAKPTVPKPVAAKPVVPKPVVPKPAAAKPAAAAATPAPLVKKPEPAKPSAADIIAKAKAKRSVGSPAAKESKPSAADIIAKAKAKREGNSSPAAKPAAKKVAVAAGGPRQVALAGGKPKVAVAGARKRPAGGGTSRASARRREPEEEYEEKSKAPMIIVGVLVLGGASFGAWSLLGGDSETGATGDEVVNVPAETTGTPTNAAASSNTPSTTTPAVADSNTAETTGSSNQGAEGEMASETPEASTEAEKPKPVAKASEEFILPAAGEKINTRGVTDPSRILLDQITPLEKAADTSNDVWKEAVEDLALYLEDSGASSNRAGNRLVEDYPRAAYPAIVNAMMKTDFSTADGLYQASALNNLIIRIGTKDLSWRAVEFDEVGSDAWDTKVAFNKKVVAAWHNLWVDTYASSLTSWNAFSNVKSAGGAVEEADTGGIVGPDDDLFD